VPRKVVSYECFFDRDDGCKKEEEKSLKNGEHIEINIGSTKDPKMIKVGKNTPKEERDQIVKLLKEYRDVLAFSYDELKFYSEDVLQHTIPLKEGAQPFKQKLR